VYRRYAGLFFCVCVDANDNELAYLEAIHLFVEILGAPRSSSPPPATAHTPDRLVLRQRVRARPRLQLLQGGRVLSPCMQLLTPKQVYAILDEIFLAGEIEETSKDVVLARLDELEKLE
jgi:AP-2 complex subunit sigma-1